MRLLPNERQRLDLFLAAELARRRRARGLLLSCGRRAAWGMRAAVPAGVKVVVAPGESIDLPLVPIGGDRIVRGHGGLVDGPLDEPGALEAALALARERGYLGA